MVRPDSEIVEDSCDRYFFELDAAVSGDRKTQIHNPIHVVPIRDEVEPQLRRVIIQNRFDGREAFQEVAVVGELQRPGRS